MYRGREITVSAVLIMQCDQTQRSGRALTLLVCVSRGWKPGGGGGNRWLWHCIWSPASIHCAFVLCTTQAGVRQGDKTPCKNQFPVVEKHTVTRSWPFAPSSLPQYTSGPHRSSALSQSTSFWCRHPTAHTSTFRCHLHPQWCEGRSQSR